MIAATFVLGALAALLAIKHAPSRHAQSVRRYQREWRE